MRSRITCAPSKRRGRRRGSSCRESFAGRALARAGQTPSRCAAAPPVGLARLPMLAGVGFPRFYEVGAHRSADGPHAWRRLIIRGSVRVVGTLRELRHPGRASCVLRGPQICWRFVLSAQQSAGRVEAAPPRILLITSVVARLCIAESPLRERCTSPIGPLARSALSES